MTPERKAAVLVIESALRALADVVDREDGDPPTGVDTAWIAVTSRADIDSDGDVSTSIRLMCGEEMAMWQMVGLLRAACLIVESRYSD